MIKWTFAYFCVKGNIWNETETIIDKIEMNIETNISAREGYPHLGQMGVVRRGQWGGDDIDWGGRREWG